MYIIYGVYIYIYALFTTSGMCENEEAAFAWQRVAALGRVWFAVKPRVSWMWDSGSCFVPLGYWILNVGSCILDLGS